MTRGETDDPELSPSEIVETHILPDEVTAEELNIQNKRPRRRRRRRRRKRPRPTENPEELESYYSRPEDENIRKHIKYRLPDNTEDTSQDNKDAPRRRNQKRRRRPLKRPAVEDYLIPADEQTENTNITQEYIPNYTNINPLEESQNNNNALGSEEYSQSSAVNEQIEYSNVSPNLNPTQKPTVRDNEVLRVAHEEILKPRLKTKKVDFPRILTSNENLKPESHPHSDFSSVQKDDYKFQNQYKNVEFQGTINVNDHNVKNRNKEATLTKTQGPVQADQISNAKRRHRPSNKNENSTNRITKIEMEFDKIETNNKETKNSTIRKPNTRNHEGQDINSENGEFIENTKIYDDSSKSTEQVKKEIFKIRRLPPISAILRHMKTRPFQNVTESTTLETRNEPPSKTDENLDSDIFHTTDVTTWKPVLNDKNPEELFLLRKTEEEKPERGIQEPIPEKEADSLANSFEKNFSIPVIKYVDQKQSESVQMISTSTTTKIPITISNTTENTAFIYISCNHTINEVLRNTINFTGDNITLAATKYLSLIRNHTHNEPITTKSVAAPATTNYTEDTEDTLKSVTMEELGKLLEDRTETTTENSTIIMKNTNSKKNRTYKILPLEHTDSGESESQLDYHVQRNVFTGTSKHLYVSEPEEVRVSTEHNFREPKWFQDLPKYITEKKDYNKYENPLAKSSNSNKELILTYTSTSNPNFFYNEIDQDKNLLHDQETALHFRSNSSQRTIHNENAAHRLKNQTERKKLPLAVKSAIIISGAILALAVLGFFALLLSCKIRQAKSRMKCHRELYREQFQNSEFRQSSRSTSPVVSKSNYSRRSFSINNNNIHSNIASNRNYYLWQTLRKTFQYD